MKLHRGIQLAVLALVLGLTYWIVTHTRWQTVWRLAPLSGEAATDEYYAAKRLARLLGAQAETLAAMDTLPAARDTLLVTAPWWGLFRDQDLRIRRWVEDGGHLVIEARLLAEDAWSWIGITTEALADDNEQAQDDETDEPPSPSTAPPATAAQRAAARFPDSSKCPELWEVDGATGATGRRFGSCWPQSFYLATDQTPYRQLNARSGPQAMRLHQGQGTVTVYLSRDFDGRAPLYDDVAQYFAWVTDLRPGTRLWFFPHASDASLPVLVWQEAGAAVLLLAITIVFALWRAIPRFGPLAAALQTTRRALSEQIVDSGEFVHRSGQGHTLLLAQRAALEQAARARMRAYEVLTPEERARAIANYCGMQIDAVHRAMHSAPARDAPLEWQLQLLENARRQLLQRSASHPTTAKAPS